MAVKITDKAQPHIDLLMTKFLSGEVKTKYDHYWTSYSDSTLREPLGSGAHSTVDSAMLACINNKHCRGVVTVKSNRHILVKGTTPVGASGKTAYVRGSSFTSQYSLKLGRK